MHRIKLTGAALAGLLLAEPLLAHSFDAQPSGGLLPGGPVTRFNTSHACCAAKFQKDVGALLAT